MAKKNEEVNEETVKVEQPITPSVKVTADESEKNVEPTKEPTKKEKLIAKLADEVDRGAHGSGRERMLVLKENYVAVQAEVNRRARERSK